VRLLIVGLMVFGVGCETLDDLGAAPRWFVAWCVIGVMVVWNVIESNQRTMTKAVATLKGDLTREIEALAEKVSELETHVSKLETHVSNELASNFSVLEDRISDLAHDEDA
jgi:hypothetical protein